jgi:hypothetical protein
MRKAMDEKLDKNQLRVSRTLNVEAAVAESIVNEVKASDRNVASGPLKNSLEGVQIEKSLEKEKMRLELQREIEKKYELIYSSKLKALEEKEQKYIKDSQDLAELLASVKESFAEIVSSEFTIQNNTIALLVLESLYKLIGNSHNYKEFLEKNIVDSIGILTDGIHVTAKLSQYDYDLLVNNSLPEEIKKFIVPDKKLVKGQFYLDDGTSVFEAGILDRLDVLRTIFLDTLEN